MTPNFLEYFDRLKQGDYQLLQHLEAHGYLNGFTVAEFIGALVIARMVLAQEHLDFALTLDETNPLHRRQIISRCYYCMHHAARAVLLFTENEETTVHRKVINKIRNIAGTHESIILNEWHDWRTEVDYNPSLAANLQSEASLARLEAQDFLNIMRNYLRTQGASYV